MCGVHMCNKRPYFTFIIAVLFVISYITIFISSNTEVIIYLPKVHGNIKCYNEVDNDTLPSVEDPKFSPKSKSIFFIDTSCRGGIDSWQACAVESAARTHSDWEVYLLLTAPVTHAMLTRSCLTKLLQYPNVKLARIHAFKFSNNTVVSQIVQRLQTSSKPVQLSANIMKMLVLNKWGGVCMDLDVFVLNSFIDNLPKNWIEKEFPNVFSGVLRFSKGPVGENFTEDVLREISALSHANIPFFDGELAIDRVLARRCGDALFSTRGCSGIAILGPERFYTSVKLENSIPDLSKYYLYKWNNEIPQLNDVRPKIAKQVCPIIYRTYGNDFNF